MAHMMNHQPIYPPTRCHRCLFQALAAGVASIVIFVALLVIYLQEARSTEEAPGGWIDPDGLSSVQATRSDS